MPSPAIENGGTKGKPSDTYAEDVVRIPAMGGEPEIYGLVVRCWADEHSPEAQIEAERLGIAYQPLAPGELEVVDSAGKHRIVSELGTTVVDRGFMTGDFVKYVGSKSTAQAGVVSSLSTRVQLERALDGEKIAEWIDVNDLVGASRLGRGDHVVFGDWVGMIEEVFDIALVESQGPGSPMRRVCDTGNTLVVGSKAGNIPLDRTLFPAAGSVDLQRIVDVRQIVVAINWLCMSQLRDPARAPSLAEMERPKRYWTELDQLALVRSTADHQHLVGDRVTFRDPSRYPPTAPNLSTAMARGHNVFVVINSTSTTNVLFQDGTTVSRPSTSFEPAASLDEDVDVFPGDVGVFAANNRVGVVQAMDNRKRTVRLKWMDPARGVVESAGEEVLSALEFDPHGPPPEVYGVRRQDFVLLSREEDGNGTGVPTVPRLGESEVATGQFPSPEHLRAELSAVGLECAARLGDASAPFPLTGAALAHIDWYGEITNLLLDGRVLVRFPSGVERAVPLNQIYHLDDGLEGGMFGPMGPLSDSEDDAMSVGSWETDREDIPREMEEDSTVGWAEEGEEDGDAEVEEDPMLVDRVHEDLANGNLEEKKGPALPAEIEEHDDWRRFVVLEEAPSDHHYASEPIQTPSKSFMARVKKEYNVLSSSLPVNILVRAYEDRADLLRCLIIGPLGTPFQNAPFLFDIFLSPTRFPQDPPAVFFHSWAGGTRVSPNLYAEGKVCLSLLGTWSGDKMESWSSGRSSILQILISIQSLIMVDAPYYTEPGFERHSATVEGQTASDLYNERTYVLTRAFVKRGCEYPPSDFGAEIRAYYLNGLPTTGPGALKGIVEQSRLLLEESDRFHSEQVGDGTEEEEGERKRPPSVVVPEMKVLTEGACLSLRRTFGGLEALLPRD